MSDNFCRISTGDFVGSALRGPRWTPYAQAIANSYPIQRIRYLTKRQTLTIATPYSSQTPVVQRTRPQLYDMLILGMSVLITGEAVNDNGSYIYLNITDLDTGIPWCAPNFIGYAPVLAFGGVQADPNTGTFFPIPVVKLPEAYFWPRGTMLKLDWIPIPESLVVPPNLTATLTMICVELVNPTTGSRAPEYVTMPNGEAIRVGSRLPWFGCVPFGRQPLTAASAIFGSFSLPPGEQATQFLPPADCNVELHDTYGNFLAQSVTPITDKSVFRVKLQNMRSDGDWTPELAPAAAVFGNEEYVNPNMPFVKPYLLKTGHRAAMVMINNSTIALTLNQGTVTFRGVRLCEY